ncbi:hypothetical protein [Sphingobium sp. CECT 9361]|uniref:hypothetical protein n=1 Tax=Sphingobium sp. CECT 9361 TaxID=2845384 RepID=UPI001E4C7125|nr:hypothetical protein [Sphingobium sp. CECT 9361]CAH0353744.1 hypothetical protein SPH9361_02598 [Sphingobium sp. CECT 9361]
MVELQHLANGLGNAALKTIKFWPENGEGRNVKAGAERMSSMLDATHDRSGLEFHIDHLELVVSELRVLQSNAFFQKHVAPQFYVDRKGRKSPFGQVLSDKVADFDNFVSINRPLFKSPREATAYSLTPLPVQRDPNEDLPNALKDLTPGQQPGPLQFEFRGGLLRLKQQLATPSDADAKNVASARSALNADVATLLACLFETNCDPRLVSAVEEIQSVLSSDADIIRIGLMSLTCDHLFVRFSEELSEIAAARFAGFSMGINLYIGQFPEWHQFTENAARTEYTSTDIKRTYEIGKELVSELQVNSLVDPEVPRSIELILEALHHPMKSGQRALFGVVRSLENLFAKIFSEIVATYVAMADGARSGLKTAAKVLVFTSLLTLAVNGATQLSPTAERVLKTSWLKTAADLVKDGLNKVE